MRLKLILFVLIALGIYSETQAQGGWNRKRRWETAELGTSAPDSFKVSGFAEVSENRRLKNKNERHRSKLITKKVTEKPAEIKPITRTIVTNRFKDIEVLIDDLDLAKIQKPVFRGILTEHLRDVENVMNNTEWDAATKNEHLKQLYAFRNKRLIETLNKDQYRKWDRIRDQDEFLEIPKPVEQY